MDMKKIVCAILAAGALAACSKTEPVYESTREIGFTPFARSTTKAAENTADYNDELPVYVFANAGTAAAAPGDYTEAFLADAKFAHRNDLDTDVFGGVTEDGTASPYYWPNVKKLVFAGYSDACNAHDCKPAMNFTDGTLCIKGYVQSAGTAKKGDNDLMWFPTTSPYGKQTPAVPVTMYHACSWITVRLCGDAVTAKSGSEWKITDITINGLTTRGDVDCVGQTATWSLSAAAEDVNNGFVVFSGSKALTTQATEAGYEDIPDNTIVLPQTATDMDITYSYVTPAGATISETANVSLALDKTNAPAEGANDWKAGYHYIYTVTITASEILIQPSSAKWTEQTIPETTI